ncbi:MAG: radical SAM protein [Acidobacteria bacterium]|nr:radical SAM protein [Acidobacteriota bacterium]
MFSASEIYSFDRAGRLLAAFNGRSHFWRGLSGIAVEKFSEPAKTKQVIPLSLAAADELVRTAQQRAAALGGDVVERIRQYDPVADRQAYAETYGKVPIIPPDQYLSLVLQVAKGCPWNRCTFCDFYRDQKYRLRTPAEFREHVRRVEQFLGPSQLLRRSLFLGDADLLSVPQPALLGAIDTAREVFPGRFVYGFSEAISVVRRTAPELAALREAGVRRLYLGAESGHDPLLEYYDKRSRSAHVRRAVAVMKQAGLAVGLIFLVGVEARFEERHAADTVDLALSLPLGPGDMVYLSPLHQAPAEDLRRRLAPLQERGAKVALYDIRQMVY